MSTAPYDSPEPSTTSLVTGILGDLQHLVAQQLELTRREIEDELQQRTTATAVIGMGLGFLFLAAVELCMATAYLMHWMSTSQGGDQASLPLWACHGIVAAGLSMIGIVVSQIGRARFRSIDRFSNPATEIFQEHAP